MSVLFSQVERQVAIRINALIGTDSTALAATYNTTPLTQANYQSTVFPRQAVLDAILWAEERIADAIASTGNHPYRSYLIDWTPPIPDGSLIPAYSATNKPILGIFGSVFDAVDNIECTEQTIETIKRYNRSPLAFPCAAYYYKLDGWRCYNTRGASKVRIDVCSYDRAAQAAIQAMVAGTILLPDSTEWMYETGALSYLVRDDEFMGQAGMFGNQFESGLMGIRQGLTTVSAKEVPSPTVNAAAT